MSKFRRRWDRHAIKAEIHRRGSTLADVARQAGLAGVTCRVALIRSSPAGEAAIAAFLGVPVETLWPERHQGRRELSTPAPGRPASRNDVAA